jgi:hypothetical protein
VVGVKAAGAWATGFLERRANLVLAGCVLATLAAGLVATVALGDQIRFVDEAQYLAIGRSIADHGQIHLFGHPSAYRTPGWPAVIAVVDLLGGGRPVVRFLNFVFEAGAIAGVYALTRTFASGAAAALAALLMAAYPFAVYTATTFYPQTMAAALVPVSLLALVRATETGGPDATAVGGRGVRRDDAHCPDFRLPHPARAGVAGIHPPPSARQHWRTDHRGGGAGHRRLDGAQRPDHERFRAARVELGLQLLVGTTLGRTPRPAPSHG